MLNLETFFKNHFLTSKISDDHLSAFGRDHIKRIASAPTYAALAANTQALYEDFFGAITDESTKTALREARTVAVNLSVKAAKDGVSQAEGSVRGAFTQKAPEYQEFFPQGLTEYRNASLSNLESLLQRLVNAATAHAAKLPGLAATLGTLLANFSAARTAQQGKKQEVGTGKAGTREARESLCVQLMKNVLTIALDHIGDPQGGMAFFDQSIIRPDKTSPAAPEAPKP